MKQASLNISSFNNDSNQVLEILNNKIDFDLHNLSETNQQLIIKLSSVRDRLERTLKRYSNIANRLSDLFDMDNLKLYDLASFIYDNEEKYNMDDFHSFCNFSFFEFEDFLENELSYKYHDLVEYIGRTSSFYYNLNLDNFLHDYMEYNFCNFDNERFIQYDIHERGIIKIDEMEDILYELLISDLPFSYNEEDEKNIDQDDLEAELEELITDLDQLQFGLIKEFFNDDKNKSVIKLFKHIKSFKDNQIELFLDYVDGE